VAAKHGLLDVLGWLRKLAAQAPESERDFNAPVFVTPRARAGGGHRLAPTSRTQFVDLFKLKVQSVLGCDPVLYAGYSLRRGGVTEMLSCGVPLPIIKRHVGWAPGSDAVSTYYDHAGRLQMRIPTAAMGASGSY